jgi:hypothetical protein
VRAAGFRDDTFERFLGRARYRWMRELGNLAVVGRSGGRRVKIKSPAAATELLEFAREAARQHRRVIFFCGCPYPRFCHRHAVSQLVLRYARARGINLRISEWPGGKPTAPGCPTHTCTVSRNANTQLFDRLFTSNFAILGLGTRKYRPSRIIWASA